MEISFDLKDSIEGYDWEKVNIDWKKSQMNWNTEWYAIDKGFGEYIIGDPITLFHKLKHTINIDNSRTIIVDDKPTITIGHSYSNNEIDRLINEYALHNLKLLGYKLYKLVEVR